MTPYSQWVLGVLQGIAAPANATTLDALWAWSGAESLPRDRMSICNPLDTTWSMPGAIAFNTLPSGAHVWQYASVQDGITATVATLLQPGYYPTILSHLRNSVPRAAWGDCAVELGRWGTGAGWLRTDYGPFPAEEDAMQQHDVEGVIRAGLIASLAYSREVTDGDVTNWYQWYLSHGSNLGLVIEAIQQDPSCVAARQKAAAGVPGPAGPPGPAGAPGAPGVVPDHHHQVVGVITTGKEIVP